MMKKLKKLVKKVLTRRNLKIIAILCTGIVIGLAGGYALWGIKSKQDSKKAQTALPLLSDLDSRRSMLGRSQFDRIDSMIASDLAAKRINQEQADKIREKLKEIRQFYNTNPTTTPEGRNLLREKRNEWREWAKQNNIPLHYVMTLY